MRLNQNFILGQVKIHRRVVVYLQIKERKTILSSSTVFVYMILSSFHGLMQYCNIVSRNNLLSINFFQKFVMKHNSYFALYDDVQSTGVVVAVLRHQIWENNLKIEILGKSTVISHYYVIFFLLLQYARAI